MADTNYVHAKSLYELKQKAIQYYLDNGVPQKIEEILNSMFYDNPEDVYGHLANYFDQFTKPPVISRLTARKVLNGKGQPSILTEVYCRIKNREQLLCTSVSPSSNSLLLDNAKLDDWETEEQRRAESVKMAVSFINQEFSPKLQGMQPTNQAETDAIILEYLQKLKEEEDAKKESEGVESPKNEPSIKSPSPPPKESKSKAKGAKGKSASPFIPDEPREQLVLGAEAVCAVSQIICIAGAVTQGIPVYEYISNLYNREASQLRMPLPMVTIMQSGKAAAGKLNCIKEFMIVPSPDFSYTQSLDYITGIYAYVEKSLVSKFGGAMKSVSDTGALCPVFDRPEPGLDLLIEAITAANLTPGEDIYIAINAAGHEMFDFEKNKYEVMVGTVKGSSEIVDFWTELLGRYPSVKFIVDPVRKQHKDEWLELCNRITKSCFVVGENLYHRPGLLKSEELPNPVMTNAIVLAVENLTSLSELNVCIKKMEGAKNQIILAARAGETQDDFLADLAVGINARFIKIGAPRRAERTSKYNRLLQIELELESKEKLAAVENLEFVHIMPPPPAEGERVQTPPQGTIANPKDAKKEGKKK